MQQNQLFKSSPSARSSTQADSMSLSVIKRDGRIEPLHPHKINKRIFAVCWDLDLRYLNPEVITRKVVRGLREGITTAQVDELLSQTAAYMATCHPHYSLIAGRICVSSLHKTTPNSFSAFFQRLRGAVDTFIVSDDAYEFVQSNARALNMAITGANDFNIDYFGYKTMEKSYLLKMGDGILERPQYMFMRTAIGIHAPNMSRVIETYNYLSEGYFIHATPTLFNASSSRPQMASCFLLSIEDTSIEGIYNTVKQCAVVLNSSGGIGLGVSGVPAGQAGGGTSDGIVPMLRVFNNTSRYVDNGSGKVRSHLGLSVCLP
jgi:ribonucleotide reductase alpha subunit